MFKIQSINLKIHDTAFGGFPYVAIVSVSVDSKYWAKLKKDKQLGMLYGVDISNEVYKISERLIPAYNPMVSDRKNAKNGVKSIVLEYHFKDHALAEKLGFEILKLKNGEMIPKYGQYINLFSAKTPRLKAVVTEYSGANALNRIYGGQS